jgi:transcriptional regulator with XRE-family HTH domain
VTVTAQALGMPVRDTVAAQGQRRSRFLRTRIAEELVAARHAAGLSLREVGRRIGSGHARLARLERGDASAMTIDVIASFAAAVGLELAASVYPAGAPVRDKASLALLERFRRRLHPDLPFRREVPVPLPGDRRSGDGVLDGAGWDALVEAETRLHDIQRVERDAAAKQRDIGARRLVLLVADTRHNRAVIARVSELRERFPIGTRACLAALAAGRDPGGDCLVLL